MPSTIATNRARTRAARRLFDFAPGGTALLAIAWVPLAEFRHFLCGFVRLVGASVLTLEIAAANDAAGAGAVQVKPYAGPNPDQNGEQVWLEASAQEIHEVLPTATHVSVRAAFATGADRGAVYYERGEPRFPQDGLTADIVA